MKNKKLFMISSLVLLSGVTLVGAYSLLSKESLNFKSQAETYRFTMDSTNKVEEDKEITLASSTGSGLLQLSYSNVAGTTTGHVSLNAGGSVKNTSAFKGIQSISYVVEGDAKINYGKSSTRLIFEKEMSGTNTIALSDTYSYFEITANSETTIVSLSIEYPCNDVTLDVKAPTISFSSDLPEVIEVLADSEYTLPTVTSTTCDGKVIDTEIIYDTEKLSLTGTTLVGSELGSYTITYRATDPIDSSLVTTKTTTVYVYSDTNSDTGVQSGGVLRIGENSYRFPESKMSTNGVGNEYGYDSSVSYGLTLNQKVLCGDFSIEFDVDSYKTNVYYPKLMISLGKEHSNFYIASNFHETSSTRVESYTQSLEGNVIDGNGSCDWNNSQAVDINAMESHHYKFESKDGYYNFYLDGTKLSFTRDGDGSTTRTIIPPMFSFYYNLPVRISTNGVSCNVRNITVTTATSENAPAIYSHNSDSYINGDGNPEIKLGYNSWSTRWQYTINAFAVKEFIDLSGNYTVKLKATYSSMTTDSKFCITFGSVSIHFCAIKSGSKVQLGDVWTPTTTDVAFSSTNLVYDITLIRDGTTVTVQVPSSSGGVSSIVINDVPDSAMYFWAFNEVESDYGVTITLSDMSVTYN
ncbi:MAG: hypothetical protein ACI31G_03925 [Bacilli bacterium]